MSDDARWMAGALALGTRGQGRTAPNPAVGCVLVRDGVVVGRGWTQPGGRPHAEAMALGEAGARAAGATAYVTLEPCAHRSQRGPACAALLAEAGVARVVAALTDPDTRTAGQGLATLRGAGVTADTGVGAAGAERDLAAYLAKRRLGRAHVTLKLALSLDGCLALADGRSRWITGERARVHAHLERARADAIVVGRGTAEADDPALDVRWPGLEARAPRRYVLSRSDRPLTGRLAAATLIHDLGPLDADSAILSVLVEGGAGVAASLLTADRVDRLLLYRAPILLGGRAGVDAMTLPDLAAAHERWRLVDRRALGDDTLEVFDRVR